MTQTLLSAQIQDLIVAFLWTLSCWVAGVAWALYRALSWADRIHAWARSCPIEEEGVNT